MHLVWAVSCKKKAEPAEVGFDVTGLGAAGFLVAERELPRPVNLHLLLCFESDATDETEQFYELNISASGPDGDALPTKVSIDQRPDSSPRLASIERYYEPVTLVLLVTSPGEYLVRFSDFNGERYVLLARYVALPNPALPEL